MARVVLLLAALTAVALASPGSRYSTKYDNVNLDAFLKNERLLKSALKCLMDQGTCTPDLVELKKYLPDALKHSCSKCSEKQKAGAKKALLFLIEKKPEQFAQLEKKYDPEGIYRKQYQAQYIKDEING